ncbi:NAD-dependent epimerase/dehydratase family protein [Mycobacterium sp. IDR2000157661]|uniref:NAD-dependent epimerase/dehydratase family protein n=1 Tax=Mycobacterium sp. IDR2000157661 TaxID=2867005 RepID=UPI001EEC0F77|nr:NAD(P)-dependent oxidoreductase [Mycobacterium sp. IDR2000157661]ULE31700.1 NAD(P)-dependent oxidoreductase [Mycobacterium sp. IDR2000157661]
MSETVLVTGGFGLVGSATVRRLAELGRSVVVADLDTPANRKSVDKLPDGVSIRWTDLTDAEQVQGLITDVAPESIIHLAAVIPPRIYQSQKLARRVNVDATATLVRIAEAQTVRPRFVHASSNAVFGPRNPHTTRPPLRADDPMRPCDLYSGTKAEAEAIVRSSRLEWVVLRFGGVLGTDISAFPLTADALLFESALPTDGRLHSVDVRDVAWACAAATTADATGEILLIAGDDSHRHRQGDVGAAMSEALGVPGAIPKGRPGDPSSDSDWFVTDWMDTTRAQEALQFQHHAWPDMMAELRANFGFKRYLLRPLAPLARGVLKRRGAYWKAPGTYADPWGAIRARLGEPAWDQPRELP